MSCDLPSYEDLKQMYEGGWTYQDLASEFGCAKSTVFRVIKENALARGEWPLRPALSRAQRISRTQANRCRDDLEDSSALAMEIRSQIAEFEGSTRQWCATRGLRYPTVNELLRGAKPRITRQLGERLQDALQREEQRPLRLVPSRGGPDAA